MSSGFPFRLNKKVNVEETPKLIHYMWLDFNNLNTSEAKELTGNLKFFQDRIHEMHDHDDGWDINYISVIDTVKEEIKKHGDQYLWILDILDNKHIGPAHKSDVLRFFYLYTQGGVWMDITTILIEPLGDLVEKNYKGFSCYYMPQKLAQSKMLGFELLHNLVPYPTYHHIMHIGEKEEKEELFAPMKDERYKFIPENYFIISRKEHPICLRILQMFEEHYKNTDFCSREEVNAHHDKYMFELFGEIFQDKGIIKELNIQKRAESFDDPEWGEGQLVKMLKKITGAGAGSYLFNYLMMYVAIRDFSNKKGLKSTVITSKKRNFVLNKNQNSQFDDAEETNNVAGAAAEEEKEEVQDNNVKNFITSARKYNDFVCEEESCKDLLLTKNPKKENINIDELKLDENEIYLMSAQYIRLTKWSDALVDRLLTWDNTPIKELMGNFNNIKDMDKIEKSDTLMKFKKQLDELDITQIKFSSWTRNMDVAKQIIALLSVKENGNEVINNNMTGSEGAAAKINNVTSGMPAYSPANVSEFPGVNNVPNGNKSDPFPATNEGQSQRVFSGGKKNSKTIKTRGIRKGKGRKTKVIRKGKGRKTRVIRKGKGRKTKSRKVR